MKYVNIPAKKHGASSAHTISFPFSSVNNRQVALATI
jgi:hypothetical protein